MKGISLQQEKRQDLRFDRGGFLDRVPRSSDGEEKKDRSLRGGQEKKKHRNFFIRRNCNRGGLWPALQPVHRVLHSYHNNVDRRDRETGATPATCEPCRASVPAPSSQFPGHQLQIAAMAINVAGEIGDSDDQMFTCGIVIGSSPWPDGRTNGRTDKQRSV